jgi:restriction endonuclease S subunit
MITYSIIKKSQLEGATRLDSEYYQPEYLEVRNYLLSKQYWILGDHAFITDGEHGSVEYIENGIRFLTAENIQEGFLNLDEIRYVSEVVDQRNRRASLKPHDLTLSIKGTIGIAALAFEDDLPANMNRDVARIAIRDSIDPFYLSVLLNTRLGKGQTLRESSGNVQQMITLGRLRELLIPKIPDKKQLLIRQIYLEAYNYLRQGKSLYSQAEDLLLEELGLKYFKPIEELSYIVNLSDVKSVHRADAEYFQPKYEKIIEKIKKQNMKILGNLVTLRKGFEPGRAEYQNEGKLFIRVSNISKHGLIDKDQKYLNDELYQELKKGFEPRPGEILLTKDATPGIAYVLKESVEGIIAGGIIRLKLMEDIEDEYLALCINSIISQMQIDRDAGGSVIAHWKPEQIKKLQVPILPKSTQQKIGSLVRQSHQARKKAKELLEKAEREVEELILGMD